MDLPVDASLRRRIVAALVGLAAVVLVLGLPGSAHAGPEINIPRAEDGPGIKAGQRSTFHAGAALVVGVDTNVFSTGRDEPRGSEVGPAAAALTMPTVWLGVGNRKFRDGLLMSPPERSGRVLDYYFGAIVGWRLYLARNPNVRTQGRSPSVVVPIRLALLPGRKFSANLDIDIPYYTQAPNYEAQPGYNFNRLAPRGQLMFTGRPGGGRFSFSLGPRFQMLRFDNRTNDPDIAEGNRLVGGFGTGLKWRFLPKSALVLDYQMDRTYYICCGDIGRGRNEDSYAHRITGGYRGQVLKKVTLDAVGGMGLGFYRDDPSPADSPYGVETNFKGFIGDLAVSYYPNPRTMLHVGLYRTFQDSLLGNYYVDAGARLQVRHEFKWRMIGTVGAWVAGRQYRALAEPGVEDTDVVSYADRCAREDRPRRCDTIVSLLAKVEQPLGRLFSVALQYDLAVDASTFQGTYANGAIDIGGFTRHVVMLFGAVRI